MGMLSELETSIVAEFVNPVTGRTFRKAILNCRNEFVAKGIIEVINEDAVRRNEGICINLKTHYTGELRRARGEVEDVERTRDDNGRMIKKSIPRN